MSIIKPDTWIAASSEGYIVCPCPVDEPSAGSLTGALLDLYPKAKAYFERGREMSGGLVEGQTIWVQAGMKKVILAVVLDEAGEAIPEAVEKAFRQIDATARTARISESFRRMNGDCSVVAVPCFGSRWDETSAIISRTANSFVPVFYGTRDPTPAARAFAP